jgi:hypothetical protein
MILQPSGGPLGFLLYFGSALQQPPLAIGASNQDIRLGRIHRLHLLRIPLELLAHAKRQVPEVICLGKPA